MKHKTKPQIFKTEALTLEVKSLEPQSRRVRFAAAKFSQSDAINDVIQKGAFAKSILEKGPESTGNRKIKYLRYHDSQHQIGKILTLEETNDFLLVEAELSKSTKGNDAWEDYVSGTITEHSIGFRPIEGKFEILPDGTRVFKEVDLIEISAVTLGMMSDTPVFGVSKSEILEQKEMYLSKLEEKMDRLHYALRHGDGDSETLYGLSYDLLFVKEQYRSLIETKPLEESNTLKEDKPNESSNELKQFLTILNNKNGQ